LAFATTAALAATAALLIVVVFGLIGHFVSFSKSVSGEIPFHFIDAGFAEKTQCESWKSDLFCRLKRSCLAPLVSNERIVHRLIKITGLERCAVQLTSPNPG
jgi:hypothetical protein